MANASVARWIGIGVLIAVFVAASYWLPIESFVADLRQRFEGLGPFGAISFAAIYVVAALLMVPGAALTLAAGALFGLVTGTLLVSAASTLVAALAFLIAGRVARERIERMARAYPRFDAIDRAIETGGWKVVLLLRLSPIVPFGLANYLFGLTRVPFWPYVLASWVGMLPGTLLYVYLGHAGAESLGGGEKSPLEWALLGAGLVASLIAVVWIGRVARGHLVQRSGLTA